MRSSNAILFTTSPTTSGSLSRLICTLHTRLVILSQHRRPEAFPDVPRGSRKRDVFRAICSVLSIIIRRLRLPRGSAGEGRRGEGKKGAGRVAPNEVTTRGSGWPTWSGRRDHEAALCDHEECERRRAVGSHRGGSLSSPPTPFGRDRPPPQGSPRIMCAATTTPSALCRRAYIRDRATVLTIIAEKRRVRERKNDAWSMRKRESLLWRCQTRRHLIS